MESRNQRELKRICFHACAIPWVAARERTLRTSFLSSFHRLVCVCVCDWENNYFLWGCGQIPISEFLELLLGARGLYDLEHVEPHSLSQGLALAHCDHVTNLDIPEVGGQVHEHVLVVFLEEVLLDVVEVVLADDSGLLSFILVSDHTSQDLPVDRDICQCRCPQWPPWTS